MVRQISVVVSSDHIIHLLRNRAHGAPAFHDSSLSLHRLLPTSGRHHFIARECVGGSRQWDSVRAAGYHRCCRNGEHHETCSLPLWCEALTSDLPRFLWQLLLGIFNALTCGAFSPPGEGAAAATDPTGAASGATSGGRWFGFGGLRRGEEANEAAAEEEAALTGGGIPGAAPQMASAGMGGGPFGAANPGPGAGIGMYGAGGPGPMPVLPMGAGPIGGGSMGPGSMAGGPMGGMQMRPGLMMGGPMSGQMGGPMGVPGTMPPGAGLEPEIMAGGPVVARY